MMSYAYDRYLPTGLTWRELFDVAIGPLRSLKSHGLRSLPTPGSPTSGLSGGVHAISSPRNGQAALVGSPG